MFIEYYGKVQENIVRVRGLGGRFDIVFFIKERELYIFQMV